MNHICKRCAHRWRTWAGVIFFSSLILPTTASAYDLNYYWVGTSGWWNDGTNWNPIGQPQGGDYAYLVQSDGVNRTVNYANSLYPTAVLGGLQIDATGTGTITLVQTQDSLSSYGEGVGISGAGTYTQSGGTNVVSFLTMGENSGSNGTYNLSGTGALSVNGTGTGEYIGYFGNGTFNQSGGTHTVSNDLVLGDGSGTNGLGTSRSVGTYNLSGGSLTVGTQYPGTEYIGYWGTGNFTQTGGTHSVGILYLGWDSVGTWINGTYVLTQSSGTYNLSGGGLTANLEEIGYSGLGAFNQSGGANTVSGSLIISQNSTYTLSGTGNLTAGMEITGNNGASTFTQSGGTNTVTNTLIVGDFFKGTYNFGGGTLTSNNETIGNYNTGTFTQSGGSHIVTGTMTFGATQGGNGIYNLNAGSLSVNNNIETAQGSGTLNIGNGTLTVGGGNGSITVGNLVFGSIAGSSVNFTLTSSGLYQGANKVAGALTAGNITVGRDGTGMFTQNGPNVVTGAVMLAANAGSSGTYNLNGGTLNAANITVNSNGTFNFNGGRLAVGTFSGNLANNGGMLAPGDTMIGNTNIVGNYSEASTGAFDVKLGGTGAGQFDTLNISGTATLSGALDVSLFNLGSGTYTPKYGDTFDILTAQSFSGEFSTLNLADPGNGLAWDVSYLSNGTTDIVALTAVPIPAAMWLFGSGFFGLWGITKCRMQ